LSRTGEPAAEDDISEEWLRAHEAFHSAILEGCQNVYLVETAERLRSISVVYRCWTRPANERTHRDIAREHREIMEASIARDGETAARLTEEHIRRTTEQLISGREAVDASVS